MSQIGKMQSNLSMLVHEIALAGSKSIAARQSVYSLHITTPSQLDIGTC